MEAVQVGAGVGDDHVEKWSTFTIEEEVEGDYDFMSQFLFNGDNYYPQYPCNYFSSLDLLSSFWGPEATTGGGGGGCGSDGGGGLFPSFSMPDLDQQPIHCPITDQLLINYDENFMIEEAEGKNGLQQEVEGKGEDQHQVYISKKRSLIQVDVQNKKKRNPKPKKNKKLGSNIIDDHETESDPPPAPPMLLPQGQSSCSSLSEDDSINTSLNNPDATVALQNSTGKTKSRQKTPTSDPPSLYARRRRERINERLRILQNLVPNGTKVDISTMLEEAVHYVKFLQLQIKLLSSDELWMYAPITYNGRNIGLDLTF